jgi:hypothetical protein
MNNEPVAWMVDGVLFNSLGAALNISFDIQQPCIPLYTHPAKTLTDEEIYEVWCDAIKEEAIVNKGKPPILKYQPFVFFARAILRKAQEK